MTEQLKRVPRTALSAPATFLVNDKPSDNENEWPIRLQARSKEVLDHWYWGRMVHDFEGMEHKAKISIDYRHDDYEILGYCDEFDVSDYGLELAGQVVSASPGDRSSEVAHKSQKGVPYEASIQFDHRGLQIEFIPEGRTTEVNGEQLAGPLNVFRKWNLSRVAICPNGYDANTRTELSDGEQFFELSIQGESQMATENKTKPNNDSTELGQDDNKNKPKGDSTELGQGGGNAGKKNAGKGETDPDLFALAKEREAREATRTELSRYCERFGAQRGAEYYVEGLSFENAIDKHARHLETELADRDSAIAELNQKIEGTKTELGESDPVSSGESNSTGGKKRSTGLAGAIVFK